VEENEEHLFFDCVGTRNMRMWFWANVPNEDANKCVRHATQNRLGVLFSTENPETWALVGNLAYKVWCRPSQAWRKFRPRAEDDE